MAKSIFPFRFAVFVIFKFLILQIQGNILTRILGQFQIDREIFLIESKEEINKTSNILSNFESTNTFNDSYTHVSSLLALQTNLYENGIREGIKKIFESTDNVAIIVNVVSENFIFEILQTIGNVSAELREIRRLWTVVLWPKVIQNADEISTLKTTSAYEVATENFRVNSQLFFAFEIQTKNGKKELAIYESYSAGDTSRLTQIKNGILQWNCDNCEGLSLRRFNFHRRELKVTAVNDTEVNDDIHVYVDSNGKVSYGKDGFSGTILQILQQLLNFTTDPMLAKEFGKPIPGTNKWIGSIGDVAEGVVDLAISVTIYQPDRAKVVSFLPQADFHWIHALFKPPDQKSVRDIFRQPFAADLWMAVLSAFVGLAGCMVIFSTIRKRYGMDEANEDEDNDLPEPDFPRDSFMWALGTVCQQGWEDHPKATSLRAIFLSGSFTGVVAYAGYSAAIVSTLSTSVDPIKTPLELLESNLAVGIRKGFISTLLEQNKTKDTMSRFYKRVEKSPEKIRYLNISSGLEQLLKHPYAYITTRDTIYDLLKTTKDDKLICGIKDLPVLKSGFPIGYPVPKFSPYREILRYAMTMLREPGILYRLRQKYSFQRRCLDDVNNAGYALGATDVFTAFMILCGGYGLSLTFLLIERIISFRMRFKYIR